MTSAAQFASSFGQSVGVSQFMKDFCHQAEVFTASDGFQKVQSLCSENTELEAQLDSRNREIEQKKTAMIELLEVIREKECRTLELKTQIRSLEGSVSSASTVVSDMEQTVANLDRQLHNLQEDCERGQQALESAHREIRALNKGNQKKENTIRDMTSIDIETKQILSSTRETVVQLSDEKAAAESSMRRMQEELLQFRNFGIKHHAEDAEPMIRRFQQLWEFAKEELSFHLLRDLPQQKMNDPKHWDTFKSRANDYVPRDVPLPFSNSKAARQMSFMVILAILAREIHEQIFQPTYILSENKHIHEVFFNLAVVDSEKESFLRSMLLSIDPETQRKSRSEREQAIVTSLSSLLFPFMEDVEHSEFRNSLKKVVGRAIDVWLPLQSCKERYETDFELDDDWYPFAFPGAAGANEGQCVEDAQDENLFIVFPRLSVVDSEGRDPRTDAIHARTSMSCYVSAKKEQMQPQPGALVRRLTSTRSRKLSVSSNGAPEKKGHFLGGKVALKT
ncbi:hypothetical protein BJX99DRAFT_258742 [Aspergillus californicus]